MDIGYYRLLEPLGFNLETVITWLNGIKRITAALASGRSASRIRAWVDQRYGSAGNDATLRIFNLATYG